MIIIITIIVVVINSNQVRASSGDILKQKNKATKSEHHTTVHAFQGTPESQPNQIQGQRRRSSHSRSRNVHYFCTLAEYRTRVFLNWWDAVFLVPAYKKLWLKVV
jgi:hypothetical protein